MKTIVVLTVASALVALASPSFAQSQPTQPPAPVAAAQPAAQPPTAAPAQPEYTVETIRGQRVYVLTAEGPIYGEVQRPYAFAVTGRAPLGYTALDATPSFLSAVNAAVRRDPF